MFEALKLPFASLPPKKRKAKKAPALQSVKLATQENCIQGERLEDFRVKALLHRLDREYAEWKRNFVDPNPSGREGSQAGSAGVQNQNHIRRS